MSNKLAKYRTISGAERYAKELRAKFPLQGFIVRQHPTDFGFGISVVNLVSGAHVAWTMSRPRNFRKGG